MWMLAQVGHKEEEFTGPHQVMAFRQSIELLDYLQSLSPINWTALDTVIEARMDRQVVDLHYAAYALDPAFATRQLRRLSFCAPRIISGASPEPSGRRSSANSTNSVRKKGLISEQPPEASRSMIQLGVPGRLGYAWIRWAKASQSTPDGSSTRLRTVFHQNAHSLPLPTTRWAIPHVAPDPLYPSKSYPTHSMAKRLSHERICRGLASCVLVHPVRRRGVRWQRNGPRSAGNVLSKEWDERVSLPSSGK